MKGVTYGVGGISDDVHHGGLEEEATEVPPRAARLQAGHDDEYAGDELKALPAQDHDDESLGEQRHLEQQQAARQQQRVGQEAPEDSRDRVGAARLTQRRLRAGVHEAEPQRRHHGCAQRPGPPTGRRLVPHHWGEGLVDPRGLPVGVQRTDLRRVHGRV